MYILNIILIIIVGNLTRPQPPGSAPGLGPAWPNLTPPGATPSFLVLVPVNGLFHSNVRFSHSSKSELVSRILGNVIYRSILNQVSELCTLTYNYLYKNIQIRSFHSQKFSPVFFWLRRFENLKSGHMSCGGARGQ